MQCCGTICHSDTIRHLREKILLKSKFGTVYDSSPHRQNHHGLFFPPSPNPFLISIFSSLSSLSATPFCSRVLWTQKVKSPLLRTQNCERFSLLSLDWSEYSHPCFDQGQDFFFLFSNVYLPGQFNFIVPNLSLHSPPCVRSVGVAKAGSHPCGLPK